MPHKDFYFDYHATTPIADEALAVMVEAYHNTYGNPHSSEHVFGWEAQQLVEQARRSIQALIGARNGHEIIFTSGATEANNLAIKGIARAHVKNGGKRKRILVNPIEHKCALESAYHLREEGFEVETLPIDSSGVVSVEAVQERLDDDVLMVILQAVNNEIGTIQPIGDVAELCFQNGSFLHCDAAQVPCRLLLNVGAMRGISSLSLSAHKMYGPKGVGCLYLRSHPLVPILPLFDGGGQERGVRSGTLPVPLLAAFGKAAELAVKSLYVDVIKAIKLRTIFLRELQRLQVEFTINGEMGRRVNSNLNINLLSVSQDEFFNRISGIAVSGGSACSSADSRSSHVLRAIGVSSTDQTAHIRIAFGRPTTLEEVLFAAEAVAKASC